MWRLLIFFFGWIVVDACIERIDITIPTSTQDIIVIDGLITDEPGPYTVKLSNAIKTDDTHPLGVPVYASKVTILDDVGNSEVLLQTGNGIYQTSSTGMRGTVGRSYQVRVEMGNGNIFESHPDKMTPVGAVDSIYYEFETRLSATGSTEHGYRIFIDSHAASGEESFLRWKFTGTYVVETMPQFKPGAFCAYEPLPCSGYQWVNGELKKGYVINPKTHLPEYVIGLECTCCRCWITPREGKPKVNDGAISREGKFNKVEMGYVPVNYYTFFEKYKVQVQQMSLSRAAFDYWKAIQAQKEGIGSLFQPVTGKVPSNLYEVNKAAAVQGIFHASAVTKRKIFLDNSINKVYLDPSEDCVSRLGPVGESCLLAFPGSDATTVQPADWN